MAGNFLERLAKARATATGGEPTGRVKRASKWTPFDATRVDTDGDDPRALGEMLRDAQKRKRRHW